ncbi:MAG: hypothetical protein FJ039_04995 [Chloroflexi bacterium]|nr:hypothetical protein [Chloroflexota bacterium]
MEDRTPTGVLIEMANCTDPKAEVAFNEWYEKVHIPKMIGTGALYNGIRFRNTAPNRPEYERRVPEAIYCTIYETNWPDTRKAYDAMQRRWQEWEKTGELHPAFQCTFQTMFWRRPEPAQGHTSEKPINGISLVMIRGDKDFTRWAEHIHIRYIVQAMPKGFTMITRYENALSQTEGPLWLHLYELDSEDPDSDVRQMVATVRRLLGEETPMFKEWAKHPSREMWYVNTFKRVSPVGAVRPMHKMGS